MDGSAPWQQTSWDWRAAGNFTFGGAGSGLALSAAVLALAGVDHFTTAFLVAPLLIGAGIALVWAETGRPKDFLRVFFNPQTSWKTREALIAPVLVVVTLISAVFSFSLLLLLVVVLSGGFLYVQGRILREGQGIAAWRDRDIVPLIATTGAAEGAALLTVLAALPFGAGVEHALPLAILLTALRWPVWTIYRDSLSVGAPPEAAAALRAFGETRVAVLLWVPLGLLGLAVVLPWFGWLVAIVGGIAAAAAGWWLKYFVITQSSPAAAPVASTPPAG